MCDSAVIVNKILAGEELSEKEVSWVIWEEPEGIKEVETNMEDKQRWVTGMERIISIEDRLFSIYWNEANTESQENEYFSQVLIEMEKKLVTTTRYVVKGK